MEPGGEDDFDVESTADFICTRGFARVALQFPDDLLGDSFRVTTAIKDACSKRGCGEVEVFILADTTFGSCCVDEVAAKHVNADAVIHYGPACLSPVSHMPAKFVFGKGAIDVEECAAAIVGHLPSLGGAGGAPTVLVLFDLEYAHAVPALQAAVEGGREAAGGGMPEVVFARVQANVLEPSSAGAAGAAGVAGAAVTSLGGLAWRLPPGVEMPDAAVVWVGGDGAALSNAMMTYNGARGWARYDPGAGAGRRWEEGASVSRELKRRYFLVEKAKDANIVGVVVGTLGVGGYTNALRRIRTLIKEAGKKPYTMVMGRVNPAKLANFPEVDVFVLVACAQTALLDSKEFMAPIITPYEAELAFEYRQWTGEYRMDFGGLAAAGAGEGAAGRAGGGEPRFSLVKGGFVGGNIDAEDEEGEGGDGGGAGGAEGSALALRTSRALLVSGKPAGEGEATSAAEYLAWKREYRGLEAPGQEEEVAPVTMATKGLAGRAAGYAGEP